jgi:hypothetical protein
MIIAVLFSRTRKFCAPSQVGNAREAPLASLPVATIRKMDNKEELVWDEIFTSPDSLILSFRN